MPLLLEKKSPMRSKILNKKPLIVYCLLFVALFGGFLRFYNLNWDQGHFFHPDERNIALAVSKIDFFSQLNPEFFAYGSFPIYLYRAIGDLLVLITQNPNWVSSWGKINLIGRGVSAFVSSLTIILIFLLCQKIWNKKVALLASFLVAFNPSLIQTAHFGVTESMLVFWLILILLFSFETIKNPSCKNYVKIGIVLGLAWATKISALSFLIIPIVAHLFFQFKSLKRYLFLIVSFFTSFLTFAFFSPYAFLSKEKFTESLKYETGVVTGRLKVVYVLQFEKTLPYLFQIKNFFWQMGPVALIGILGIISLLVSAFKNKNKKTLIFLSFPVIYFIYAGSWYTKFIRYMVPILPSLATSASWLLFEIVKKHQKVGQFLILTFCSATIFWALAFFSIYTREQTRITASKWIYKNIPQNSKILTEHWDDGLPIPLPPESPEKYKIEQLTIYEPDNQKKRKYYAEKLSGADFIVINSRRLYGTLMYLPEKYPVTSRYYQLLFSKQLGYHKVAQFASYPSIFGIEINDDKSEETFQVYDHPKVIIFKNTQRLNSQEIANKFY